MSQRTKKPTLVKAWDEGYTAGCDDTDANKWLAEATANPYQPRNEDPDLPEWDTSTTPVDPSYGISNPTERTET